MDLERVPAGPALTRRQAAVDIGLTIALVPVCAITANVVVALLYAPDPPNLVIILFIQGLLTLAGVSVLLRWREQRFTEIGLRGPRGRDLPRAVMVLLAAIGANMALTLGVYAVSPQTIADHLEGLQSVTAGLTADTPLGAALALMLLVGFYEEIVARGVLLSRSRRLLGGVWPPVLFSAALFGLAHVYQGPYGAVQTALLGAVLAAFTIRWGTLWPAILAHSAINMLAVVQLEDVPLP
ncbi:MAG TPA: type II CAAX endopeptidase family protein [Gammaproteobacteria bacterium]